MMLALKTDDGRSIFLVAGSRDARYGLPVAANSAIGFGRPNRCRRNSAPYPIAGAFFVPAVTFYGGCAQDTFGCAGFLYLRSTNLCTAATHSFGRERGSSQLDTGATPMHALNPSAISPELQKAYCSRLLKTLLRYSSANELMRITAALESEVSKTLATRFVPGLNDASYDVYRSFWLKGGAK